MKTFLKHFRRDEGFTLVELMVVVAIIGLLSAVAIPNFKKYQAKSKTSEAKLALASIYSSETAWMSDYDFYASCLNLMGFDPSAEVMQRYYAVGFTASHDAAVSTGLNDNGAPAGCIAANSAWTSTGTNGPIGTLTGGYYSYAAGKRMAGGSAPKTTPVGGTVSNYRVSTTGATFTAAANGIIDKGRITDAAADLWTITDTKLIRQVVVGY